MPGRARPVVVRVIARLNIGGPALHVINLTHGMRTEFPTLLVAGNVDDGEAEVPAASDPALPLRRMPSLGRAVRPFDDVRALFGLIRIFRETKPRIVHTHTAKAGTLGRIAAAITGVPIRIHTYHGHVFRGYFTPSRSRAVVMVERLLARWTTRIITISESQKREITQDFAIAPASKVDVVPLGLDIAAPPPDRHERRARLRAELGISDEPLIAMVGRLVPIKNHTLFVEAMAGLLKKQPHATSIIVGGGPEESRIRALIAQHGIGERVRMLGWRYDLADIYAASDVVALTSANEGTPVALIEALAAGCRVVATDVGGVADVLEGGKWGTLVPAGDDVAFAAALDSAIQHESHTFDASAASARAIERFGTKRLVRDLSVIYRTALEQLTPALAVRRSVPEMS